MGHIVNRCPLTQLNGGLLHEADDDAVNHSGNSTVSSLTDTVFSHNTVTQ